MEYPRQITVIQAAAILISTIIGVGVLPLPRFAVDSANTGAPMITLLGIALSSFGLWLITKLGMRFPNKTIIRYSEDILGRWVAAVGSLAIVLFFAVLSSLAAREFGEVVVSSVLRRTPLEVTVIVMLTLAALNCRHDITTFAYIHHFYLPVLVAPGLVIVALSLKNSKALNLLPVIGNTPHIGSMMTGVLTVAALFQGMFVFTMVIPAMRRPERAMKASFWGMAIAGGLYFLIVIATVSVFGSEEIKELLWPTLELARTTSLPANILERLDAPFLIVWVIAVFTTIFSSYYLMIHSASELFRLRDHKLFSFFSMPFVFVMAMLSQNVLQMYKIIQIVGQIGLSLTIGYPLLLLVVASIRKKRGDQQHEGNQLEKTG
ncbi:MAG: GerAB/ArcD/ProY family transporter [Tumebacillaceae bacterium]